MKEYLLKLLNSEHARLRKTAAETLGALHIRAVKPLINKLSDDSQDVRLAVIQALGQLEDAQAVEPLILALKDKSWKIRLAAANALNLINDTRAVIPLIAALYDNRKEVQSAAIDALKNFKDKRAVEPLISLLPQSKISTRCQIAKALGKIGDLRALEPLIEMLNDRFGDVRAAAAEALGEMRDHRALTPLIAKLKDKEYFVAVSAAKALKKLGWTPGQDEIGAYYWLALQNVKKLVEIGPPAVECLLFALKERIAIFCVDEEFAAICLGKIKDTRAVNPLIRSLKDKFESRRAAAAKALGEIGDPRAVKYLITALNDQYFTVRKEAVIALGRIGNLAAVEPLIKTLKDDNKEVRRVATWALGILGDTQAIKPLIKALNDESKEVRRNAAKALDNLGWQPISKTLKAKYWIAKTDWEKCLALGDVAVPVLLQRIKDQNLSVSISAIKILGKLKNDQAIEPLIKLFSDHNKSYPAKLALIEIGRASVGPLIKALNVGEPQIQELAIETLGEIGDKQAVEPIVTFFETKDLYFHYVAAVALGKIKDPRAVEPLILLLKTPIWDVRQAAVKALGNINEVKAVPALIHKLRDENKQIRKNALQALKKIEKKSIIPLQNVFPDLVCRNCFTRAKQKTIRSKLFKNIQIIVCRNCGWSYYLIPGIKRVIGIIGGPLIKPYHSKNLFYCNLWDIKSQRAQNADIDELRIIGGDKINYDFALRMVLNELKKDKHHSKKWFNHITLKLVNNPSLDNNTLKAIQKLFRNGDILSIRS